MEQPAYFLLRIYIHYFNHRVHQNSLGSRTGALNAIRNSMQLNISENWNIISDY